MKNAIILHGRPSKNEYYSPTKPSMSNSHWIPWLQAQLLKNDIKADTPEVPYSFEPLWERWVDEVERFEIGPDTTLVGHSCGGGFWVRYLSEHPNLIVGKVVLVAPWLDVEQEDPNQFFKFKIDPNLTSRTKELVVFHSDNDGEEMQTTLKKLQKEVKDVKIRIFNNYGHFGYNITGPEFPELLQVLIS